MALIEPPTGEMARAIAELTAWLYAQADAGVLSWADLERVLVWAQEGSVMGPRAAYARVTRRLREEFGYGRSQ